MPAISRSRLVAGWRESSERVDASQHVLGGLRIAVDGDEAMAFLNELVWLLRWTAWGSPVFSFGNAMELRLRRLNVGWRIVALSVTPLGSDGNSTVLGDYDVTKS